MKRTFRLFMMLIAASVLPVTNSCTNEEDDPFRDNSRLLSADRVATMTESNVQTLLSAASGLYPEIAEVSGDVASGVVVYSVTYNTTFKGDNIIASGLIAIPDATGDYPVISFQNGTNTLYSNVPSVNSFSTLYQMMECVASTGYIVVIPDYIGFGSSENIFHPYLHKESTVSSVLDLLRACDEFDDDIAKNISFLNEYYLMGYSQGGWSTLATLEAIDKNYSSEFNVAGCACGAGPYDIKYFTSYILDLTEYPMPTFLAYLARSYNEHGFITNSLTELFNEPYATNVLTYFDGRHSTSQINDQLTTVIADLFTDDFLTGFGTSSDYESVRNAMTANSVDPWNTTAPLLFIHGDEDAYVPVFLTENMYNGMMSASTNGGTNITSIVLSGMNHPEAIVPACIEGLKFFKILNK